MHKISKLALPATILLSLATPALSDECMRLWIVRNAIFDDRGYCFGSSLGKGFFGNAGCTTKNPSLSSNEKSRVAQIKAREGALNCASKKNRWSVSDLNAEVRRAQSQQSQPQRRAQPSVPAPQQQQVRSFQCSVPCKTVSGFTSSSTRQDLSISINSTSKSDAQSYVRSNQSSICRDSGLQSVSQYAFCN